MMTARKRKYSFLKQLPFSLILISLLGGGYWVDDKYEVYENATVYPRAFVVHDYIVVGHDQEIIDYMFNDDTNLRKSVVLEEEPIVEVQPCKRADKVDEVDIVSYTANEVEINISAACSGLLFLSDNYYPGWNVYDGDGVKQKIYRADYTFRAVVVPAGASEVIFKYENWYF